MLVLTRKCGEKIRIGNKITITIFHIKGKAVRLGIEAPTNITILRGELRRLLTGSAIRCDIEATADFARVGRNELPGTLRKLAWRKKLSSE